MLSQPSLIEVGESGRVAVRLGGRELLSLPGLCPPFVPHSQSPILKIPEKRKIIRPKCSDHNMPQASVGSLNDTCKNIWW